LRPALFMGRWNAPYSSAPPGLSWPRNPRISALRPLRHCLPVPRRLGFKANIMNALLRFR